jgi:predicted outer membrane repeat protein
MSIIAKLALLITAIILPRLRAEPTVLTTPDFRSLQAAIVSDTNIVLKFDGVVQFTRAIYIDSPVTLDGSGHTISFEGGSRLFLITNGGALTMKSITVRNSSIQGTESERTVSGAAITLSGGALTLDGCTVSNNLTQGFSSIPSAYNTLSPAGGASGGAIDASNGRLNFRTCLFQNNVAIGGSGSVSGPAAPGFGGALSATGCNIDIDACVFKANRAGYGTPVGSFPSEVGVTGCGGAISVHSSVLTIQHSIFADNNCTRSGGAAIYAERGSIAVRASSFSTNSTSLWGSGGGILCQDAALLVEDSSFLANTAFSSGGAIATLSTTSIGITILRSRFISNIAQGGGAIYASTVAAINQSLFLSNRAEGGPSSKLVSNGYTFTNPPARAVGGAIYTSSLVQATNCAFFANSVRSGDGYPAATSTNYMSVPGTGGAISADRIHLVETSFASNSVEIAAYSVPDTSPKGSALSVRTGDMQATLCAGSGGVSLIDGPIADGGFNICSDGSGGFTNATSLNSTDPLLQYLPEQRFSILRPAGNSPAIGRVTTRLTDVDVRGALRGELPHDAGAVELDGTTSLSIAAGAAGLTVSAPNYLEGLRIFGSDDLRSWTEVGMASPMNSASVLSVGPGAVAGWRFFKGRVGP